MTLFYKKGLQKKSPSILMLEGEELFVNIYIVPTL